MDFRRIEWIFLVVFAALNLFLGLTYFQSQQVDLATTHRSQTTVISEMTRDQIKLPKLTTSVPSGAYLAAKTNHILSQREGELMSVTPSVKMADGFETLTATVKTPTAMKQDQVVPELKAWRLNSQNVINGSSYTYASGLSSDGTYVFVQAEKPHMLYDRRGMLVMTVKNNRLVSYTQTYVNQLIELRDDVSLATEQDAVATLYRDNDLPANSKVQWTKLAYSYLLDTRGSTLFVPTWFVKVENQGTKNTTIKRVNAITKTVVKSREVND